MFKYNTVFYMNKFYYKQHKHERRMMSGKI